MQLPIEFVELLDDGKLACGKLSRERERES